mgnify:FL=1|jgi:hypothetical protein|tara:strand:+ start:495 stop:971 length:477 start_codon:yes stop_codon:yes gene_type:complete
MNRSILLALLLSTALSIIAQETAPSTGGDASGSGGSSSFTVGQVFYTTNTSSTGSVSQGMQQAFEIQTRSNPGLSTVQLTAVTYPNPTTDYLVLKITDTAIENLQYTLFDLNGKTIISKSITTSSTEITMKNYSTGIYLLKLTKKNQLIKTFKIIKKQ